MRLGLFFLVFALAGCDGRGTGLSELTSAHLFPTNWKNPNVTLRIANLEVPAEVSLTAGGARRKLTLTSEGSIVEQEVYDVTTESIGLVQLGTSESFAPPIPLLKFPLEIGANSEWQGQMLLADKELPATATISSERVLADMPGGALETILVTVALALNDGAKAERKLRVWFANGEGPIKRDFGNQIREPRAAQ